MIEQTIVEGRPAWVAWLRGRMEPCGKDEAEYAKICFDDGATLWWAPIRADQAQASEPRVPAGEKGGGA